MKFQLKISNNQNIAKISTDCLIITTSCLNKLPLPSATLKYLNTIVNQEELNTEHNLHKYVLLFKVPAIEATRLLLLGTNKKNNLTELQYIELLKTISANLNKYKIHNATVLIDNLVSANTLAWHVYQTIVNLMQQSYMFEEYKTKKKSKQLPNIDLLINAKLDRNTNLSITRIFNQAIATGNACKLTKDLAHTPPNICTTEFLAQAASALKKKSPKVKLTILNKTELAKLHMGALLAVAQGSLQPPKLICLEYQGAHHSKFRSSPTKQKSTDPIVFIGKGITFDTGGNSLKPANAMVGMKFDMCGAATVLGIIDFAIRMDLPLNIIGIIPAAENMPGRHASRPDDVVKTMAGMTVEILNTDAEGRLILCDALTYCKKFNPKIVIDVATLTGACAATFGHHYSGLFSNNQKLANQLMDAGNISLDKAWQLPITEEYHKYLDSDIADLANVGGHHAGSITAACFLAKFATNYVWAHLDIAGTAYHAEGKIGRQATGKPVPLLTQYLISLLTPST